MVTLLCTKKHDFEAKFRVFHFLYETEDWEGLAKEKTALEGVYLNVYN